MKTYKQFNEGVTDYLSPKSEDDIVDKLKDMSITDKMYQIRRYNLSDDYMPSDEEIRNYLDKLNVLDQISDIRRYRLPNKYMPSDEEIKDSIKDISLENRINMIWRKKLPKKYFPTKQDILDKIKNMSHSMTIEFVMKYGLYKFFNDDEMADLIEKAYDEKKGERRSAEIGDWLKFVVIDSYSDQNRKWIIFNKSSKLYDIYGINHIHGAWKAVKTFMT